MPSCHSVYKVTIIDSYVLYCSSDIQSALMINSMDSAVSRFMVMANLATSLQPSSCENLKTFVTDTLLFWYNILKDKLTL